MNVLWGGHADLLELGLTLGLTLNLGLGLIDGLGRILGLWLGLVLECGRGLGWDSLLHLHHLRRWPKLHTEAQTQRIRGGKEPMTKWTDNQRSRTPHQPPAMPCS
jgi:hypothetical protein